MTDATPAAPTTNEGLEALARIRGGHVYRPMDDRVASAIDDALAATLGGPEARAVVLTGPSGAGKTTLLRRTARKHARLGLEPDADCRILYVCVPGACTLEGLGRRICHAAGYPIQSATTAEVMWERARQACHAARVRFLHLDEIQHITATARKGEDTKIRDTLKTLLVDPEWAMGLILSGLPQVVSFLEADPQLSRRMTFLSLDRVGMETPAALKGVLGSYARQIGLKVEPAFPAWVAPRLAHAALGQFGTSIETLHRVLEFALNDISTNGDLKVEHFAAEFARRTGNAAFANPYLTGDWEALDCSRRNVVRAEQLIDRGSVSAPRSRKRGGR